ncbi:hypothetical protein B0H17DRAFT_1135394 [Mycena rosella]|uniref:Uncharacterized protein n=1 Tax=Mycena rosella TaxID=1033263 RepID=A0AAD7DDN5_MYCRO|nr:hypothetical protein B0H17DRAFT_1135394 [Mycena rosella]
MVIGLTPDRVERGIRCIDFQAIDPTAIEPILNAACPRLSKRSVGCVRIPTLHALGNARALDRAIVYCDEDGLSEGEKPPVGRREGNSECENTDQKESGCSRKARSRIDRVILAIKEISQIGQGSDSGAPSVTGLKFAERLSSVFAELQRTTKVGDWKEGK